MHYQKTFIEKLFNQKLLGVTFNLMRIINLKMLIFPIIVGKILLFLAFSSEYSNLLFIPFLVNFAQKTIGGNFISPWSIGSGLPIDAFPYHPTMLYIYGLFQIPGIFFNPSTILSKVLFILPSVCADFLIFKILLKFFPSREKAILILYFLSPVILYAVYMHGQLDLWPTAMLFVSVYFLLEKSYLKSAIFFGISMTFKLHVIAALPIYLAFVFRRQGFKTTLFLFLALFLIYGVVSFPWFLDESFRTSVLFNPKQDLIWKVFYKIGDNTIYLPLMATLVIYLRFFGYVKVNKDLFVTWIAILFAIFVLLIPPAPGWYVWLIPYLMYFYLKHVKRKVEIILLNGLFTFSYLLFFIFVWKGEYLDLIFWGEIVNIKSGSYKIAGICYTLLQTSLILNLYKIYKIGVRSNRIYTKPDSILIGIGGDSGAGKSTLLHALERLLSPSVTLLEGDGDHRWERGNQNYKNMTHLNPRANYLERQAENLIRLKKGEVIFRPDYNHDNGTFTHPIPIKSADFIILSGLHTFYLPKMRKVTDIKIFINTDKQLRLHWKILRDTTKRGYSRSQIEAQLNARKGDSEKYIHPQRYFADLIIDYYTRDKFKVGSANISPKVLLKLTLSSEFHVEDLVLAMEEGGWLISWDYGEDLKSQYFTFESYPNESELQTLASTFLPSMEEVLTPLSSWENSYLGIVQLFVLVMVNKKYLEVESE
jgi:uridine kinase